MGSSPAICCLETFVHTNSYPRLALTITRFQLPDNAALYCKPDPRHLPTGWNLLPLDRASIAFGTAWLREAKYLGLIVPSAILPLEHNIVLNPLHPDIHNIHIEERYDFMYDDRMFTARG